MAKDNANEPPKPRARTATFTQSAGIPIDANLLPSYHRPQSPRPRFTDFSSAAVAASGLLLSPTPLPPCETVPPRLHLAVSDHPSQFASKPEHYLPGTGRFLEIP